MILESRHNRAAASNGEINRVPLKEVVDFNPAVRKRRACSRFARFVHPDEMRRGRKRTIRATGDRKVSEVSKGYTPFRDGDVLFAKVTRAWRMERLWSQKD